MAEARRGIRPAHRNRRKRHWTVCAPGTAPWWRQVRSLGVRRSSVETTLRIAGCGGPGGIDPHSLTTLFDPDCGEAERVVTRILAFRSFPSYQALMYLASAWDHGGRTLKEWLVCQFAWLLEFGDAAEQEAARYSLSVDVAPVEERARFVLPRLQARVGRPLELPGSWEGA